MTNKLIIDVTPRARRALGQVAQDNPDQAVRIVFRGFG